MSATIRVAAQVAICRTTDTSLCTSSVVGGMVRADERRLEDLRNDIQDRGLDILMMAQAVTALASTIV